MNTSKAHPARRIALVAVGIAWLAACQDRDPTGNVWSVLPRLLAPRAPIVSDPRPPAGARVGAALPSSASSSGDVVYVSMPPGTVPDGGLATISDPRTGGQARAAMAAGGFDPVVIMANAGDTLTFDVELVGGRHETRFLGIPPTRPPVVVRTQPPPRKRDVPLNASMVVVFSEPIDSASLGGIRLLHGGAPVGGRVTLSADHLLVTLQPDQLLTPNSDYVIAVSTTVRDQSGEHLAQSVETDFTTGTTVALDWVGTAQTALIQNPFSGELRVFDFSGTRYSNGAVSGTWRIFYPGPGLLIAGPVNCFTVQGNQAWVAGIDTLDSADPDSVNIAFGWRVEDNGPPANGVPDQLSLAYPLQTAELGTAQAFCATTPLTVQGDTAIDMYNLLQGDIVVGGDSVSVPQPRDTGMSRIAYAGGAYPGAPTGGIRVLAADLSYLYSVTTAGGDWNPAWSPDGKKLAFESDRLRPGDGDIYVINADGTGLVQLTNDGGNDRGPAWSPDGGKITFSRDGVVYVMNAANGSGATRLSDGINPSWSPDGSRIVSSGPGGRIWVMNADGSGATQLTFADGFDDTPEWSPDGQRIVFQHSPPQLYVGEIYVMNADGSGIVQLAPNGQMPSWSPDGKMILFEFLGIEQVNLDGSGLKKLGNGFGAVWSPTGRVPAPPRAYRNIAIAGGDGQSDSMRATLFQPLTVRIVDDNGVPVPGVAVRWWPYRQPGANIQPSIPSNWVTTDAQGYSSERLTLGDATGPVYVEAMVMDGTMHTAGVVFAATATGGAVTSVTLSPPWATVLVGATYQWSVTATDTNGYVVTGRPIVWASSDPAVATVDSTGLVTAVGAGTAAITATVNGHQGSATVQTVRGEDVQSWLSGDWIVTPVFVIRRGPGGVIRCTGTGSFYFTTEGATLGGGAGISVPGCSVGLHVSSIAGFEITATAFQFSADCSYSSALPASSPAMISGGVTCGARVGTWTAVRSGPPVSISVTPSSATLDSGTSTTLTGRALNGSGQALLGRLLVWSSDNPAVATVSAGGVVSGLTSGSATITAATAGLTGQASITVAPFQAASKLGFSVQPSNTAPGTPIVPAVQVEVQDAQGRRVSTASDVITLHLVIGDSGTSTLSGTTTMTAVGGVATFADLSIDRPATNYMLTASAPGFTDVTSSAFNVGVSSLEFTGQPTTTAAGAAISPPVRVSVRDAQGNVDTLFTGTIALQIGSNPGEGVLSGTTAVNAVAGVATFGNLSIDRLGVGYTLVASYVGLLPVTSAAFDIQ